jgi:MFS family permease
MRKLRRIYTIVIFILLATVDNVILGVLPALYRLIGEEIHVSEGQLGAITAVTIVVMAITALFWGYRGDQSDRRRLLILGTLAWAVPVFFTGLANTYPPLFITQVLSGIGLGCIATVGYSIITDLIPPRGRGLAMSMWGLSQGAGGLVGSVLAGALVVRYSWHVPFLVVAGAGAVLAALGLLAERPTKGAADPELHDLIARGEEYAYQIEWKDLPAIIGSPSNRWLMLQGFIAQFAFGSLLWVPTLYVARLTVQGHPTGQATAIAALLAMVFQFGGVTSVFFGWLGDRCQQRDLRARPFIAGLGMLLSVPLYLFLFFLPIPISPAEAGQFGDVVNLVTSALAHSPALWLVLVVSFLALAANSANAPNWFAMVSDVNLPEHRGTVFSLVNLANNIGRAAGNWLVALSFAWLAGALPEPTNYALGLTIFQLFFIPAGVFFLLATRSVPRDIVRVRETLAARAAAAAE